ncbi:MAG: hypothetical protein IPN08_03450 [Bacteroidales bacterium]|nr:hypothetical protein [Bacteroidales bacterium]
MRTLNSTAPASLYQVHAEEKKEYPKVKSNLHPVTGTANATISRNW